MNDPGRLFDPGPGTPAGPARPETDAPRLFDPPAPVLPRDPAREYADQLTRQSFARWADAIAGYSAADRTPTITPPADAVRIGPREYVIPRPTQPPPCPTCADAGGIFGCPTCERVMTDATRHMLRPPDTEEHTR